MSFWFGLDLRDIRRVEMEMTPEQVVAYDQFRSKFAHLFKPFVGEEERLRRWREERLREVLPMNLFDTRPRRRSYHMKEILMLQPRGPRVLVKRVDAPKLSSSTLIIPETVDGEKSNYGVVLAVGNKITEDIKQADTVILAPYCGSPVQVELDGEMLDAIIVMQDDILAVVED